MVDFGCSSVMSAIVGCSKSDRREPEKRDVQPIASQKPASQSSFSSAAELLIFVSPRNQTAKNVDTQKNESGHVPSGVISDVAQSERVLDLTRANRQPTPFEPYSTQMLAKRHWARRRSVSSAGPPKRLILMSPLAQPTRRTYHLRLQENFAWTNSPVPTSRSKGLGFREWAT